MEKEQFSLLSGVIMDDTQAVSLAEICQSCSLAAEQVVTMIDYGIIEPVEPNVTITRWQFSGESLLRVKTAVRLQHDLGVNLAGAALVLELLDELKQLRHQRPTVQHR